jgi:hypothetical protein
MKENPKTNFVLVNKINTEDDNDYNVILSMSNEIYIKEFDKILKINNINSVVYDSETKTKKYDNKIEYTLSEKNIEYTNNDNENVNENIVEINNIVNTLESYMNNMKQRYLEPVESEPIPIIESEPIPIIESEPVVEPETIIEPIIEPIPLVEPVVEKKYRIKIKKPSTEMSDIEYKIQYHLKLITTYADANNIIDITTKLVKFIDNFPIEGSNKKNIIISVIKKFLSDENNSKYLQDNQWEKHQSDDGQTYWWNNITDVSTWTKPNSNVDYIINTICSPLIDILISVDKRKIVLKKNPSCCFVS